MRFVVAIEPCSAPAASTRARFLPPRVERLGPADRLRSNFIGGIKHLPVRLHESTKVSLRP